MAFTERVYMDVVHERLDKAKIDPINKKYIKNHDLMLSAKGIGKSRRKRYIDIMKWWGRVLRKDFKKVTKEDLIKAVESLQSDKFLKKNGNCYSDATKELYKTIIKTFYKWLEGNDNIFPEKIRWLQPKVSAISNKLPKDIFSEEDIEKMIKAATSARDQAVIAVLYESGARISEFLGINLRDLKPEKQGMRIFLEGKTGRRSILIVSSIPYIMAYLNTHPESDNPDNPLWFSLRNGEIKALAYETIKKIIRKVGGRAGIKKPLHAHNFRHSRETILAKVMTESQLAVYFGHVLGSNMIRKYVHLSGKDNDSAILKFYGLAQREDEVSRLAPSVCRICSNENPPTADFCSKCGRALSQKAVIQTKEATKRELVEALSELVKESDDLKEAVRKAALG